MASPAAAGYHDRAPGPKEARKERTSKRSEGRRMRTRLHWIIVGTGIEVDSNGLPTELHGEVFEAGPDGEPMRRLGTYHEKLVMILDPDLRGAHGQQRYETDDGAIQCEGFSIVMGARPDGGMQVQSRGRILLGTDAYRSAHGSFASSSLFRLSPFELKAQLTLLFRGRGPGRLQSRRRARAHSSARWRPGSGRGASW